MRAAKGAERAWRALPTESRAVALEAIAENLTRHTDELVEMADAETALGAARLRGEILRTHDQLKMFADFVREGSYVDAIISAGDPTANSPDVRRMLVPIGPVAVFTAGNFPFAFSVAGGDTASALAVGCPVVAKAHEGHPRTSLRTAELVSAALSEAGAPDGVFSLVFGVESGRRLVLHPDVRAVGFTGSVSGGRALHDLATGRPDPIPFYGELGSVNPVVVLPGAARDRPRDIASGYVASLTIGAGQYCTNPGLLFVPDAPELLDAVQSAVSTSSGGTMLSKRIFSDYVSETRDFDWVNQELLARGVASGPFAGAPEARLTTLGPFTARLERLSQEIFGPAGLVIVWEDVDELITALADLPGSLVASVHASEAEHDLAAHVAETLLPKAGRLVMNGWPTGVAVRWAMHHGGPWPATTASAHTSVGATAVRRWLIPIAYQDWPDPLLPPALQNSNPLSIRRLSQDGLA